MLLDDIGDLLTTGSIGTVGSDVFLSLLPDTPDQCVSVFETGGSAPLHTMGGANPAAEQRLTLAAVKVAAEHGVNLNHTDFTGATALHDAAARGLATVVSELAERGADINALDGQGRTPLDLAVIAEQRISFFGFDLSVPGPSAREVLEEFGAVRSE